MVLIIPILQISPPILFNNCAECTSAAIVLVVIDRCFGDHHNTCQVGSNHLLVGDVNDLEADEHDDDGAECQLGQEDGAAPLGVCRLPPRLALFSRKSSGPREAIGPDFGRYQRHYQRCAGTSYIVIFHNFFNNAHNIFINCLTRTWWMRPETCQRPKGRWRPVWPTSNSIVWELPSLTMRLLSQTRSGSFPSS